MLSFVINPVNDLINFFVEFGSISDPKKRHLSFLLFLFHIGEKAHDA